MLSASVQVVLLAGTAEDVKKEEEQRETLEGITSSVMNRANGLLSVLSKAALVYRDEVQGFRELVG